MTNNQNSLDAIDRLVSSLVDGSVTRLKKKWQFNHSGRQALEMMAEDIKPRAKAAINKTIMERVDELVIEVLGMYAEDVFTPATDADRKYMNKLDPNLHTRIHCSGIRHGLHQLRRAARGLEARDDLPVIHVPEPTKKYGRADNE